MFIVLKKAKVLRLPFDIVCELFDKCVVPVLLYGSEVWGWSNLRDVEIFHRSFITLGNLIPGFQHNKLVSAEIRWHQQIQPPAAAWIHMCLMTRPKKCQWCWYWMTGV